MKAITAFRYEDYGLFIDLVDKPASVAVHRKTGDVLLDEGDGDDRFHGAALSARSFRGFTLQELANGQIGVQVQFGRNQSHLLGGTADKAAAKTWIQAATRAIDEARQTSAGRLAEGAAVRPDSSVNSGSESAANDSRSAASQ